MVCTIEAIKLIILILKTYYKKNNIKKTTLKIYNIYVF